LLEERRVKVGADGVLPANPSSVDPFKDKVVIIGSTTNVTDPQIHVPGANTSMVPSIYALAAAVDTQVRIPLHEFTPLVKLVLGIGSGILTVIPPILMRMKTVKRRVDSDFGKLATFGALQVSIISYVAGILLARNWGILWEEFLLTALLLLIHPRIEHSVVGMFKKAFSFFGSMAKK